MSSPEVVSRGFVYIKENTDLLDNVRKLTESILYKAAEEKNNTTEDKTDDKTEEKTEAPADKTEE